MGGGRRRAAVAQCVSEGRRGLNCRGVRHACTEHHFTQRACRWKSKSRLHARLKKCRGSACQTRRLGWQRRSVCSVQRKGSFAGAGQQELAFLRRVFFCAARSAMLAASVGGRLRLCNCFPLRRGGLVLGGEVLADCFTKSSGLARRRLQELRRWRGAVLPRGTSFPANASLR